MEIKKATRKAVPLLIALAGEGGSGKTYSALLLAAGLAGEGGRVGFLDTENGRGEMYADSNGIMKALPSGYEYAEMREPFAPMRFYNMAKEYQDAGVDVLVIDSQSHEYEGYGGMEDIAAQSKTGWLKPKMEHKKMMYGLQGLSIDIIFCLRARSKVKVEKNDKGKAVYIDAGVQPVTEKNFMFEMTLSMLLDPLSHKPLLTKCPEPLLPLFTGEQTLITKELGKKLREWKIGGAVIDEELKNLKNGCRIAAQNGNAALDYHFKNMPTHLKAVLKDKTDEEFRAEMRSIANQIDEEIETDEEIDEENKPTTLFKKEGA